jgi:hypothetical protein
MHHKRDKTEAAESDIPNHSRIAGLIDRLIAGADSDGYLVHSHADNVYGSRGTLLGKQFAALNSEMGFGETDDLHSIKRTVAHMLEAVEAPEGVAQDIMGHKKAGLTYRLHSGITKMDQRSERLERAIVYPE